MKKYLLIILFVTQYILGYSRMSERTVNNSISKPQISSRAGDCAQGKAQADLDINNIRARLLNSGDLWWDRSAAKYAAPKLTAEQEAKGQRQTNPIFAGALWISGKNNGQLRMAAVTYSQGQNDFWAGPITSSATIDKAQCNKFDVFFKVNGAEIKEFIQDPSKMTDNIKYWPGKNNHYMPSMPNAGFSASDFTEDMAPFYDKDGDGDYNPDNGDYPAIKYVKGTLPGNTEGAIADQMIFWVLNDVGNTHTGAQNAIAIGLQINCIAFAFATTDDLNNMTFYRYEFIKKSTGNLSECVVSQFVDTDMGDFNDDYVGCTPSRDLGFCVNADAYDATTSVQGYGDEIPILGVDFFEGAIGTNGLPIKMTAFNYFINQLNSPISDPQTATEFRNFQDGKTRTGGIFTKGGDCISGTDTTKFCFPGNPAISSEWSMCSASYPQRDVRFVQHSGQFVLASGSHQYVSIGVMFVQPPVGSYKGCKIDLEEHLYAADDLAQTLFENDFKSIKGPDAPDLEIIEQKNQLVFNIKNPIGSNNFGESFNQRVAPIPNIPNLIDSTYKFEGYLIYQLSTPSISKLSDLQDASKARLVKLMDIKNGVSNEIINLVRIKDKNHPNDTIWAPTLKLSLNNEGIKKTFVVTEDLFELEGRKNLVNNKSYYFAVVAYAYNNYQNPGTSPSNFRINNRTPLLFSGSVKIFSAIPHNFDASGVKANSSYFENLAITRISGRGHGFNSLELEDGEEAKILEQNSVDVLKYKAGYAPISAYVNNPYKLKAANFKLTIMDSSKVKQGKVNLQKGYWELEVDGNLIASEKNIDRPFEQPVLANINGALEDYGVTVGTSLADSIGIVPRNKRGVYNMIEAKVIYSDSKNEWLQFLKSDNEKDYIHWIRSGTTIQVNRKFNSAMNFVGGVATFADPNSDFAKIYDSKIAPYCITANNSIEDADVNKNYSSYGPAFKWKALTTSFNRDLTVGEGPENNLDSLFSVDLVITNDKSKWSQCVVLETGETPEFHEFKAFKGQIRKAPSLDTNQSEIAGDLGRSYFPGYAINLETGQRVNVYFGENSRNRGKGGANMWWDPTDQTVTTLGSPILGGSHFVYITNTLYDGGSNDQKVLLANFNKDKNNADINLATLNQASNTTELNPKVAAIYKTFIWTFMPHMKADSSIYDNAGIYRIPSDVRIKLRVQSPYAYYIDNSKLEYEFNTNGMTATRDNKDIMRDAFNDMRIVPNPYNAYSVYESSVSQNIIQIINVPKNAKISIFTTDGILVRTLKQSIEANFDVFYGADQNKRERNSDNSISWDLRTNSGVLVSSGVYYINVESPEYGSKVLKLFATMRAADVSNF